MSAISWPLAIACAVVDVPGGDHALLHRQAPFGHDDRSGSSADSLSSAAFRQVAAAEDGQRIRAASILAGLGM